MTLLADLVAASREITDTSSRSRKVGILAALLARLDPNEVAPAVGFLAGVPRQGRIGVGYSTIYGVERAPAGAASLTIAELDRTITAVQGITGSGSAASRRRCLGELLGRATEQEADFVKRLFTGELRQGALAGLMVDAIATAAGVSGALTRRALMLSGDLSRTAEIAIAKGEEGLREAGRRGKAWRKVKPVRTYDLVVLGAEWGHGRRQGWLSNLYLGARTRARANFRWWGSASRG